MTESVRNQIKTALSNGPWFHLASTPPPPPTAAGKTPVPRSPRSRRDAAPFERTWTGVGGVSAYGAQTNHLYLAVRGTTLVVLEFDEYGKDPAAYNVRARATTIGSHSRGSSPGRAKLNCNEKLHLGRVGQPARNQKSP